jgi:peptidoglycan/LPS O-acetylase OafA/YrhL
MGILNQGSQPALKTGRIESLDIFRGLAILAVVGIHVLGHILPNLHQPGAFWLGTALLNRALQFAVPAFLTLSAFLNIRPLWRGEPLGRFARKRLLRALWPYVLWTLLYALFRYREHLDDLGFAVVWDWLLTGNAYYHLYFLLLVLQLYVLLPLLAPMFRKRPGILPVALVTLAVQMAVYFINRRTLLLTSPGSVILWYLPSVALGCWLATRSDRLRETVRRGTPAAFVVTGLAGAVYLYLGLRLLQEQPLSTLAYQASLWVYAPGAAFLLLALSESLTGTAVKRWMDPLGARSLEIYLVHPLVIWALDETIGPMLRAKAAMPVYYVLCVLVPLGLAWGISRLGLARWVWGTEK